MEYTLGGILSPKTRLNLRRGDIIVIRLRRGLRIWEPKERVLSVCRVIRFADASQDLYVCTDGQQTVHLREHERRALGADAYWIDTQGKRRYRWPIPAHKWAWRNGELVPEGNTHVAQTPEETPAG